MSLADSFKIRYGDAAELDNYDPMADVYDNPSYTGGIQNLIFDSPEYDPITEQTRINDELGVDRASASDTCVTIAALNEYVNLGTIPDLQNINDEFTFGILLRFPDGAATKETVTYLHGIPSLGVSSLNIGRFSGVYNIQWQTRDDSNTQYSWRIQDATLQANLSDWQLFVFTASIDYGVPEIVRDAYVWHNGALRKLGTRTDPYYSSQPPSRNSDSIITKSNGTRKVRFGRYFELDTALSEAGITEYILNTYLATQHALYAFEEESGTVIYGATTISGDTDGVRETDTDKEGQFKQYDQKGYYSTADGNLPITWAGLFPSTETLILRQKFHTYRVENLAAYFNTSAVLTPVSGSIAGSAISKSWGTASLQVSGNTIICTSAGSCHGIQLDSGEWYTMDEGRFGNGSAYVYDVSGNDRHLQISGMTTADVWQQPSGVTDYGYDWMSIYGGAWYGNGTSANDIFIPYEYGSELIPTASLLPSGYSLLSELPAGRWVYTGTKWDIASGVYSMYRSELDTHQMGSTAFTQSYGHHIRQTANRWDRIVVYPDNLSQPENTFVDFIDDKMLPVAITYQVADINSLAQVASCYSKKVILPATKRNNTLFDHVYNPNNANFSTLKESKECEFIAGGIEILRGKASVNAVVKREIPTSYELTAQGDNVNLYDGLDAIVINDMDLGTFTTTKANIIDTFGWDSTKGNVVFAPYDYGQWNYSSIVLEDLPPCLFVRPILLEAFQTMGIAYDSDWLDSDYVKRLCMPYTGDYKLTDTAYESLSGQMIFQASRASTTGITATSINIKERFDTPQTGSNVNYATIDSRFIAPENGIMSFELELDVLHNAAGIIPHAINIYVGYSVNGSTVFEEPAYIISTVSYTRVGITSQSNIKIAAGDVVKPYIRTASNLLIKNISWKSKLSRKVPEGAVLNVADYAPVLDEPMTCFDLLRGLAELFNLQFYFSPFSQTVKFEPWSDFYSSQIDFTEKWDNSQEATYTYLGFTLEREIRHKYATDDKDKYLKQWSDNNTPYGSYLMELPKNFKKGRKEIANSLFAPTIERYREDNGLVATLRYDTDNDNTESLNFKPRLLYYEGKDTNKTFTISSGGVGRVTTETLSYFPRLAFREKASGASDWQSLAFDSTDTRQGLFESYYIQKYRCLYEGFLATYYLNLSATDVINDPLSKIIYLDESYWIINRIIDFDPINEKSTKVELLKLVEYNFPVTKSPQTAIDKITGVVFDPISYKPNRDLPSNPGFNISEAPSGFIQGESPFTGTTQGHDNQLPLRAETWGFGRGLLSYYNDQFILGKWNAPRADAVFQVGAGTTSGNRYNGFELIAGDAFEGRIADSRILTVEKGYAHYDNTGSVVVSPKMIAGQATTSGGGYAYLSFPNVFTSTPFVTALAVDYPGGHYISALNVTSGNADLYLSFESGIDGITLHYQITGT